MRAPTCSAAARLAVAGLLAAVPFASTASAQAPKTSERFGETVSVREVSILVAPPPGRSPRRLSPADLRVYQDGLARKVTRVEAADPAKNGNAAAPWDLVVYLDQISTPADSRFLADLALARRAKTLTRLGTVTVLAEDGRLETVLPATRETRLVDTTLADLAGRARQARDAKAAAAVSVEGARSRWDRLLTTLADRPPTGGPRLLVLVSEGLGVGTPKGTAQARGEMSHALAATVVDTARTLAAYGWTTVGLSLERGDVPRRVGQPTDYERWREVVEKDRTYSIDLVGALIKLLRHDTELPRADAGIPDQAFFPRYVALATLAQASGGSVVLYLEDLDRALAALERRTRVWYEAPAGADGSLAPLEVKAARGDQLLAAPRWARTGTPPTLAEARLRRLLAGAELGGGLEVIPTDASSPRPDCGCPDHLALEITVSSPEGTLRPQGAVRVSYGFVGPSGEPEIRHREPETVPAGGDAVLRETVTPPAGAERAAVVVEDLASGRWGGGVLPLHSACCAATEGEAP